MDVSSIKLLLLIHPFIVSFFFLFSNFQTLKFFVILFSGTVRSTLFFSRYLKLVTHVNGGWMYLVYGNQAAATYLSLYFLIFLSLQFSNNNFIAYFSENVTATKLKLGTHVNHVCTYEEVSCIPQSSCCCFLFIPLFVHFCSNFQTLKIFVTLFS